MSHLAYRLQVLIPHGLDAKLRKASQRSRMSKGEWVRRALEESLRRPGGVALVSDPLARPASLEAPTGHIGRMLSEIEAGRA